MIRNDFTNETAHFANWLLCGTRIDLVEWLDDAIEAERGVSIPEEFAGENPQGISVDDAEEIIDRLGLNQA